MFVKDQRPGGREGRRAHATAGGGKAQTRKGTGCGRKRRGVRRKGNRAAAQGVGAHRRRRIRHRCDHALLPGAARLDRRMEGRQADGLSFDAKRVGTATQALPTPLKIRGDRRRGEMRLHRRRFRQQVRRRLLVDRRGPDQQEDGPAGQVHARPRSGAENRRHPPSGYIKVRLGATTN